MTDKCEAFNKAAEQLEDIYIRMCGLLHWEPDAVRIDRFRQALAAHRAAQAEQMVCPCCGASGLRLVEAGVIEWLCTCVRDDTCDRRDCSRCPVHFDEGPRRALGHADGTVSVYCSDACRDAALLAAQAEPPYGPVWLRVSRETDNGSLQIKVEIDGETWWLPGTSDHHVAQVEKFLTTAFSRGAAQAERDDEAERLLERLVAAKQRMYTPGPVENPLEGWNGLWAMRNAWESAEQHIAARRLSRGTDHA